MKPSSQFRLAVLGLFLTLFFAQMRAATYYWQPGPGNWDDPAKWGGTVPGPADEVIFPDYGAVSHTITFTSDVTVAHFDLQGPHYVFQGNYNFTCNGDALFNGNFLGADWHGTGTLTVNGQLVCSYQYFWEKSVVLNGGALIENTFGLNNGASLLNNAGSTIQFQANNTPNQGAIIQNGNFTNYGTLTVVQNIGGVYNNGGTSVFTNYGDINVTGTNATFVSGGNIVHNNCTITVGSDKTYKQDYSTSSTTFNSVNLAGAGTFYCQGLMDLKSTCTWTIPSLLVEYGTFTDEKGIDLTSFILGLNGNYVRTVGVPMTLPWFQSTSDNTSVTGDFDLTVTNFFEIRGCDFIGTGSVNVNTPALCSFTAQGVSTFNAKQVFFNAGGSMQVGTLSVTNGGLLRLAAGQVFTFTVAPDVYLSASLNQTGTGSIENLGEIVMTGGGYLNIGANFTNTGAITLNNGYIKASGNGTYSGAAITINNAAAEFYFTGGTQVISNTSITGSGWLKTSTNLTLNPGNTFSTKFWIVSGTTTDNAGISPPKYYQSNGTYNRTVGTTMSAGDFTITDFGGTFSGNFDVNVSGNFLWDPPSGASTISGTGNFTVTGTSTLGTWGLTHVLNTKTLVMNGGATMTRGKIQLSNGAILRNGPASTFTVNGSTPELDILAGGTFENQGTLIKGGSNSYNFRIASAFNNSGTVTLNTASIVMSGGGTHTGIFNVNATNIQSSGTTSFNGATINVNGAGNEFYFTGGAQTLANCQFTGSGWMKTAASLTLNAGNTVGTKFWLVSGTTTDNLGISPTEYYQEGGTYNRTVGGTMSTGNFTITSFGGTFTGNFNTNVSGNFFWNPPSGQSTISGTGTITVTGFSTLTTGNINILDAKTVVMNGGASMTSGRIDLNNNAILRNGAGSVFTNSFASPSGEIMSGGTFENQGKIIINGNNSYSFKISSPFINTGIVDLNSGYFDLAGGGSHTGATVNIAANRYYQLSGGTHTIAGSTFNGANGWLETFATLTINSGNTINSSFNLAAGTTTDNGGISPPTFQQVGGTYNRTVATAMATGNLMLKGGAFGGNFDVNDSGNFVWSNNSSISGTGTITITGSTTLPSGGETNILDTKTLIMNGGATMTRGKIDLNNNAILRNGPSSTFNANGIDPSFHILSGGTFDNQGTLTKGGSNTYYFYIDAIFTNSGTVNINNAAIEPSNMPGPMYGSFNIAPGAALSLTNATGMDFKGTAIANNGSVWNNNLTFSSTSAQTLSGTGSIHRLSLSLANLLITGQQTVTLAITASGTNTTIDGGFLDIGTLAFISGCGSALCYFKTTNGGTLRRTLPVSGTTVFPIGEGASYNPATLQMTSGSAAIKFALGIGGTVGGNTAGTTIVNRQWDIQKITASPVTVSATFQWNTADENAGFDRTSCHVSHGDGTNWMPITGNAASTPITASSFSRQATGITSFSPFAIGSGAALPIEWVSVDAVAMPGGNKIHWVTGQESQLESFIVEKSDDGATDWQPIFETPATNRSEPAAYFFDEKQPDAATFYRIRSVENDGRSGFSKIVFVERNDGYGFGFQILGNPVGEVATLVFDSQKELPVEIAVVNMLGKLVFQKTTEAGDNSQNRLEVNSRDWPPGAYCLTCRMGGAVFSKTVVKQ